MASVETEATIMTSSHQSTIEDNNGAYNRNPDNTVVNLPAPLVGMPLVHTPLPPTAFVQALQAGVVTAEVTNVKHTRSYPSLIVETEYIIEVKPIASEAGGRLAFDTFRITKKYNDFRYLSNQAKKASDVATGFRKSKLVMSRNNSVLPTYAQSVQSFQEEFSKVVDSAHVTHIGKLSGTFVKIRTRARKKWVQEALMILLANYPTAELDRASVRMVGNLISKFFLTDRIAEEEGVILDETSRISDRRRRYLDWKKLFFEIGDY